MMSRVSAWGLVALGWLGVLTGHPEGAVSCFVGSIVLFAVLAEFEARKQ